MKQHKKNALGTMIAAVAFKVGADLVLRDPAPMQLKSDSSATEYRSLLDGRVLIPAERWPDTELRRFSPPLYGYETFAECHTPRQQAYLGALAYQISKLTDPVAKRVGALMLARCVDSNSSFCRWRSDRGGSVENTFAGKSVGMMWDFFESDPLHEEHDARQVVVSLTDTMRAAAKRMPKPATVLQSPAQRLPLPDDSVDFIYTDPPQGYRVLTSLSDKDFHEKVRAPTGHPTLHGNALLAGMLLEQG